VDILAPASCIQTYQPYKKETPPRKMQIIVGMAIAGGAWSNNSGLYLRFFIQDTNGDLYEKR
jgi:hypothetical protein